MATLRVIWEIAEALREKGLNVLVSFPTGTGFAVLILRSAEGERDGIVGRIVLKLDPDEVE